MRGVVQTDLIKVEEKKIEDDEESEGEEIQIDKDVSKNKKVKDQKKYFLLKKLLFLWEGFNSNL
jgi:hypothetical protein